MLGIALLAGGSVTHALGGCRDAATQREMEACAQQALGDAERTLARLVSGVERRTSREDVRASLRTTQEAWRSYVSEACKGEAALYEGGSMAPLVVATCRRRLVKQRIQEIKQTYADLLRD